MGSYRPKCVATCNSVFNIILELCLTDSPVDIALLQKHNGMDHIKMCVFVSKEIDASIASKIFHCLPFVSRAKK
jgi:hypothetical protein